MAENVKNKNRSKEWSLSASLAKKCRRRMVAIVALGICEVATAIGFLIYICL